MRLVRKLGVALALVVVPVSACSGEKKPVQDLEIGLHSPQFVNVVCLQVLRSRPETPDLLDNLRLSLRRNPQFHFLKNHSRALRSLRIIGNTGRAQNIKNRITLSPKSTGGILPFAERVGRQLRDQIIHSRRANFRLRHLRCKRNASHQGQ